MSFQDLCDALPSVSAVEVVTYTRDWQQAWCTWDEFANVAKDVPDLLDWVIQVHADGWWVDYYAADDSFYNEWRVHWVTKEPDAHFLPRIEDLAR